MDGPNRLQMCLLLAYIIKTISFQLFEQKINKLEKIRKSKVNSYVKNEIKIIKTNGMKQPFEIILCSISYHEYFDIHLKFSNVANSIST